MTSPIAVLRNPRVQSLANNLSTPIRRRSGVNTSITVFRTPESVNDDEAERRQSRRIEEETEGTSLVEDTETLNMCLQLHSENKISKNNAWTVSIIDSFSKLMQKHHKTLQNFQVAGSTLEASAKVYGLRVDSVYLDTMRMSSELSRQSAKALGKKRQDEIEEVDERGRSNQENDPNVGNDGQSKEAAPKKKQKKRRNISTITKNKETLNAKLDTVPFTDPFFAKLNSVVGDINSSKRLMQNIIPTQNSLLKLRQNNKFWDKTSAKAVDLEIEINLNDLAITSLDCISGPLRENLNLQGSLSLYVISDTPLETDDDDEMRNDFNATLNHTMQLNQSHIDLQFDMNAEVEPISNDNHYVIDYGDMDHELDEMNEEEQNAILKCKGLKRKPMVIEDMQPLANENASVLEYSYRPLDHIGQFWAGPSHWKFRRTTKSLDKRFSQVNPGQPQGKAVARKRKTKKVYDGADIEHLVSFASSHQSKARKLKMVTLNIKTLGRKWDARKLRLPTDYKVDIDVYNTYNYAPNFKPLSTNDATLTQDEDNEYNYDNDNDRNYCSRVENETDTETETDAGQMDNLMDMNPEMMPMDPYNQTVDVISNEFIGAPNKIEKIHLNFAKRSKIVDMKQLKKCCWQLITERKAPIPEEFEVSFEDLSSLEHRKVITFNKVVKDLPHILSKMMSQNMSIPLAFYSVLHLANENKLYLNQKSDLRDFDIIAPE